MGAFPGPKVHRSSRRQLGRGQHVQVPSTVVTVTSAMSTATLTFDVPVIISGDIPLAVSGGLTLVSQTVTSPTTVDMLFSGAVTGKTYSLPGGVPQIRTFQGGGVAAASGTF